MKYSVDLCGEIQLPGSKSILNRVLIIASQMYSDLVLHNVSGCQDVSTMLYCLRKLGSKFSEIDNDLYIQPQLHTDEVHSFFIRDAAAVFRFLLVRLAVHPGLVSIIDVNTQLLHRPHYPLISALKTLGTEFIRDSFPLQFIGTEPQLRELQVDSSYSSQYLSAFLLSAPLFKHGIKITPGKRIVSQGYLEMTIKLLADFGIEIYRELDTLIIPPDSVFRNLPAYTIEPDYSSACYFWALGALNQGLIKVRTNGDTSIQPDFNFPDILTEMGAKVTRGEDFISVTRQDLRGGEYNLIDMPDQVPTMAVLALFADSPTTIRAGNHISYKESDRLDALLKEFPKLGAKIEFKDQKLIVHPLREEPDPCMLNTRDDHRLAMSFLLINQIFPRVSIEEEDSIAKSYPNFLLDLHSLQIT